jgi:hypothetical protein
MSLLDIPPQTPTKELSPQMCSAVGNWEKNIGNKD